VKRSWMSGASICVSFLATAMMAHGWEEDSFETSAGPLKITFIGHATLMLDCSGKTVHVDPVGREADYTTMPKADLVLITHEHGDHLDPAAVAAIRTPGTTVVANDAAAQKLDGAVVLRNGEERTVAGLRIEAVPAYNIVHMRSAGVPFHPKANGNGYVITCGDKRIYIAGDTEDVPEMRTLKDIDIAFLPMNLPYTMTPEMAAQAARAFMPKILYPYHYGETDAARLVALLRDVPGTEVRVRKMK